ncbi:MAG: multidrug efflux RND transporter permease subunit [Planctomycetes bacterium]|nr:multidrug efflux RND transporter permease subunit [Planctomycetota bacterium]
MLSKFFIYRPIFACVISIVIVIIGLIVIPLLPIEQTPDITPPTVKVSTTYTGASASVISETVAAPIEEQVNGVEDMLYMQSKSSSDGTMNLTITFEVGTDVDMATVLVQNRVKIAEPVLPQDVKREGINTKKQSTNLTLLVNLISPEGTYDEIFLSNYIKLRIEDELKRIYGVGDIELFGAKEFSMRIWLDPEKLKVRDLTTNDILDAVREQNVQVAAGQIGAPPSSKGQVFQYTVNTLGRLSEVEQFEDIILKISEDGRILRLKDVARVELGAKAYTTNAKLNGAPSIAIGVYQLPGANALAIADAIRAKMDELSEKFPKDVEYDIAYDPTLFISESIKEVITTLFVAVALVILTVYIFLQDLRTTLIPAITIPVSLIGTFAVMMALGISINTLSLFGLVLAIGIVVDDAIVVVENTMRIIDEEGLPAKQATEKAMMQITGPVVATTMVLLAVFVPTGMIGGITGRLYRQFAITIATATVFSSVNALTLSPALCGMVLRPSKEKHGFLFDWFNKSFDSSASKYMGVIKRIVRQSSMTLILFGVMLGLTLYIFGSVPGGFIPDEDQGYFFVQCELPDGATLERSDEITGEVIDIIKATPGVSDVISISGYSILDSLNINNMSCCFVTLDDWDERTKPSLHVNEIIASIQREFSKIKTAQCIAFLPPPITGLGNASGFEFQLQDRASAGINQLEQIADDFTAAANAHDTLTRVNSNLQANVPQLYLDVDRVKVKRLHIELQDVFDTLQAYLGSAYVNDFNLYGRTFKVMVQADHGFRSRVEDIKQLEVRDEQGNMVPLDTILKVEDTAGPQTIFRFNLYPSSQITGAPAKGKSTGQAIAALKDIADKTLPMSMDYDWSGITFQQIQAGNMAPFIFSLALVFVYLFLAAQYESWSIPMAILLSVPLAIFGGMLATFARAFDNNIYTQVGLVLLIGLSCKSAILIVEFAKQERESGKSVVEAAVEAAKLRFRPILMTAFSFILGVLPLVIATGAGAASRRSLGTAVFGGMTVATVFGVFLIPVLYVVIQKMSDGLGKKTHKKTVQEQTSSEDNVNEGQGI